jgi:hypothetical protein
MATRPANVDALPPCALAACALLAWSWHPGAACHELSESRMGTINAAWHAANRMPTNPSPEQRIAWHLAHAANCSCRTPPPGVIALMRAKGITFPQAPAEAHAKQSRPRAKRGAP